jgi:sugar phosphate isomerase/epimerase
LADRFVMLKLLYIYFMNSHTSRRDFLGTTAGMLALTVIGDPFRLSAYEPLLSFSTLGCPKWTFTEILNFASQNNYNGIELRGILGQLDLGKCSEFSTPENIKATRKLIQEKRLKIVDLGSSAEMHHADPVERKRHLDEGRRFIDLAAQLECPFVRVFPNNLPKDDSRAATIDLIIQGLTELGDYAKNTRVSVLMESHGDAVQTTELKKIMDSVARPNVGLVWDVVNMWSVTREKPEDVYGQLKAHILHTHIKDAKIIDGKDHYTLLGRGETPIFEAIDILAKNDYRGYYSFEWEKLWHPEIEEPEIALADYPRVMKQHFKK